MALGERVWGQRQQYFIIFRRVFNSTGAVECAVAAFIVSRGFVGVQEGGLAEGWFLCPAGKGAGRIPKGRRAPFLQLVAWLSGQQAEKVPW